MTSVYALIDEDLVSADVHELDIWRQSLSVGRWQLVLSNKANKWGDDFHTSDVVVLKIDGVELLRGYVDDVQPYLDPQGVYTNLIKVVGRDYGRDLAKLYVTASYSDTKGDDVIADLLTKAESEILFTSPHLAPVINIARVRTYLIDWLQEVGKELNHDAYVSGGKTLNLFAIGAAAQHTAVDLKSIADAMTNNILDLLKGEETGFSIANIVELSAGPVKDHYTDGNAADWDPGTSTTVVNEPMMAGSVVANASTSTVFKTDLPIAINDYYNGLVIEFTSGALDGQKKIIANYIGSTRRITVQQAFSEAPNVDDVFVIHGCWVGISSIKFYCIENALPSMTLDFSGAGKYGHAGLDMSAPAEMSFYTRHKCVAATASVRPRLEDAGGNIIEFKRMGGVLGFIGDAQKGKTDLQLHNKWYKIQIPIGESEDNTIKSSEANGKWYYTTEIDEFDWSNVVKITFKSAGATAGYGNFWVDNLCIPNVEVISKGEDTESIAEYDRAMWYDQRNDIKSQVELDALRESELAKRKDPLRKIHIIASGQTGSRYAGKSLDVQAPGHGIAEFTKYRIFKLHHKVRKDPITKGFNFITEYDLIKHTINPTQVVDPLRMSLADDPVGTILNILSLNRRRARTAETTARREFGDTHPVSKAFYSGSGTAFPEDPEDGFAFRLTADIPSTHLAGQYQYDEATTSWVRQPATFRRATNPTYGQLEGDINENTTDGKIYQWDGVDTWEFIGTSDISKLDGQATLDQLIDDIFTGAEGIAKFADNFWTGTGLDKFVDDFFSWDKITGSITGFWGAVTDRTSWLWSDITKTVGEICTTLGSWTDMVTELGNLAWAQITKTAGDICDILASWAGMVTELGSIAWANISGTFASWKTAISDTISWAWSEISGNVAAFWGAITDRTNWIWGDISGTFATWKTAITDTISWIYTEISGTFAQLKTSITDAISWAWTEISGTVASFWSAITDRANWIWDDISGNVTAFWGAITDRANWAWGDISGNVAAFWSAITDRANWAWGDISGTFATWKTAITDTISWIYTDISGTFAQFKTSISDTISWVYTEISDTFANFKASISDTISWVYTEIGGTFAQFKASVSDAILWTWAEVTKSAAQVMATISSWANIIAQVGSLAWADLTKTASNIMTTISSWANILSQVEGLSVAQVATALTSWATLTNVSALGELAWATITKTGAQVMATISDWTTIITQVGSLAWANLTKTASNIMTTIASWANILTQVGGLTSLQVTGVLTSWATVTHVDGLGNLAWTFVTKTVADICGTLGSWANMITELGNMVYSMFSDTFANWKATITDTISWAWSEVTKTAAQILTTIGAMTTTQISAMLTSWTQVVTGLGNLAWGYVTKTAANIMDTIASWTNIINKVGNLAWGNLTKTASNIMGTIASWANIITQVGGLTSLQVTGVLTSWTVVTDGDALGNLAWAYVTKTAGDICDTLVSWAGMVTELGSIVWSSISGTAAAFWGSITDRTSWLWADITKTAANVMATIDTWANIISEVGNLPWANLTKTATNIMNTIASWTNIIAEVGSLPWANLTKTASNIMTTISSWTNILSQVGSMSSAQIDTTLYSWSRVIGGLGNLAWGYVTKTAANILGTLGAISAAAIQGMLTSWTWMTNVLGLGKIGPSELDADFIIGNLEIKTGADVQWTAGGDPGVIITDLGLRGKGAAGAIMAEILATTGKITAGGGAVILDNLGITIKGASIKLRSSDGTKLGIMFIGAAGDLQLGSDAAADITKFADATIQFATAATLRPLLSGAYASLGTPDYPFRYFVPTAALSSRPDPVEAIHGLLWIVTATSVKDKIYVCLKNDANNYEWVQTGVST